MKILITGGAGFIASHTIQEALNLGYEVVTNARFLEPTNPIYDVSKVTRYVADIRDKVAMRAIIEKVDGVINLAGILGTKHVDQGREFYENNLFGAMNVFDACLEFNIPVVQISVGNYFETNDYSNSKYAAERECLKYARYREMKGNIVRGLNAYGEAQKVKNTGKIVPTFITKALNNEPLSVYGGKNDCGLMDMIYVKDLAKILIDALTNQNTYGNVFEAGNGYGIKVWDIAKKIVELCDSKSEILEVPMRSGEQKGSVVVAQKPYPIQYTDLEEGLKKTIAYYRN